MIKDLTIKDSNIVSTNTQGSGAFIECVDSMPVITITNCKLLDSKVTGSRTGGIIGWTSGYNDQNNGPVDTYITISGCEVSGCEINGGNDSVGAINGHAGANPATFTTIENCKVTNNVLVGGEGKTGVILGTANIGEVSISGCTIEGNTVNGAESGNVCGRAVLGSTGKLTIDGTPIS